MDKRGVAYKVFLTISTQEDFFERDTPSEELGTLEIDLWDNQPETVENFVGHCRGGGAGTYQVLGEEKKMHYTGCTFHRIIKDKFMQSGDTCYDNGCGGHSVHGTQTFKDEKNIE